MIVRPATFDDIPYLRGLFQAFEAEHRARHGVVYPVASDRSLDAFTLALADRLGVDPGFGCWVASSVLPLPDQRAVEELVGFVTCRLGMRSIGEPRQFGLAEWMYVVPVARQSGAGRQLTEAVCAWLTARQVAILEVTHAVGDDQWERRGFIPYQVQAFLPVDVVAQGMLVPRVVNGHDATAGAAAGVEKDAAS